MKVTAIIPDEIVNNVRTLSKGKNITESLVIALEEWISLKNIHTLNKTLKKSPLQFSKDFSAQKIRATNRNR
jgi:hypothetical protein